MADILDRMLAIHREPHLLVTGDRIKDNDLSIPILGRRVKEDADGWFIRHRGELVLYCAKRSENNPELTGVDSLEAVLAETWGRYTRKKLHPDMELGFEV